MGFCYFIVHWSVLFWTWEWRHFFPIFVQLLHSSGSFQMYIQYSIMYSMSKWGLAFALIRIWAQLFIHFCCFWPFMTTTSDSFHHIFFWHYQQLNTYKNSKFLAHCWTGSTVFCALWPEQHTLKDYCPDQPGNNWMYQS